MLLYRALGSEEALTVFQTGKVFPREFQGSTDSTCPAGERVSFWFDKPYKLGGRFVYAVAEVEAPPTKGTMQYTLSSRDYDGMTVLHPGSVGEYYLGSEISVSVLTANSRYLPGCVHHNRDKWKEQIAEAFKYVEADYLLAFQESIDFLLPMLFPEEGRSTEKTEEYSIYVDVDYGETPFYVSRSTARKAKELAEKYLQWAKDEVSSVPLPYNL